MKLSRVTPRGETVRSVHSTWEECDTSSRTRADDDEDGKVVTCDVDKCNVKSEAWSRASARFLPIRTTGSGAFVYPPPSSALPDTLLVCLPLTRGRLRVCATLE